MGELPKYEDIPLTNNDNQLLASINQIFKDYRSNPEVPITEFPNELQWTIGLISERAIDKQLTLFQSGFIFLQEHVAINLSKISELMNLSNTQLYKRLKTWPASVWNVAEKKKIIYDFNPNSDMRSWSLRKLTKACPINSFVNSQLDLQTSHPISEINALPPPQSQKVSEINLNVFSLSRIYSNEVFDRPPNPWKFDQTPEKELFL